MYDVFISHASEDKKDVVIPLSRKLIDLGFSVWLDTHVLKLGDSLRRTIDEGLKQSRYGIIVLSPNFFQKDWTIKELDALVSREDGKENIILPIRHNISHDDIEEFSPLLADKLSVSTARGLDFVAQQIADVICNNSINSGGQTRRHDGADTVKRSTVVGISGGSCSGKTWLAQQFKLLSPKEVCLFDLDGYYKDVADVRNLEYTHDNPDSINFDDALFDLAQLKAGREIKVPQYSFKSHKREDFKICKPAPIIVVEGVFAFSKPRFLQEFDFRVWVEADDVTRYQRRLVRDVKERGRDNEEVTQRYEQNVRPGYEKFIYPNRRVADITIHNDLQFGSIPKGLYALIGYCMIEESILQS